MHEATMRRRPPDDAGQAVRTRRESFRHPAGTCLAASVLLLSSLLSTCTAAADSDLSGVDRHLATKTRYANRLPIPGAPFIASVPDPQGYNATALWLVSRHGARFPTVQRLRQMASLEATFRDASNTADFPWVQNWTAPTAGLLPAAGELHAYGEDELWSLGVRLRERFPHVLRSPYLPRRHSIVSTQVPRAAASAFAFAAGFFPRHQPNGLGAPLFDAALADAASRAAPEQQRQRQRQRPPGGSAPLGPSGVGGTRPQAVAISMSPKDQDPLLRFYDACPAYASHQHDVRPWLVGWLVEQWTALAPGIAQRLGITSRPLAPCEVDALWTLCQYEAGLLGERRRGCAALGALERRVLEWLDDVDLLEAQGWGSELNYRIAAPLLRDLRLTLQAASAPPAPRDVGPSAPHLDLGLGGGGSRPHARLLFAHCETLVPLATLLGLFEPELPVAGGPGGKLQATARASPRKGVAAAASLTPTKGAAPRQRQRALHGVNEGVDACVSGVPPAAGVPPPEGWQPRTPLNDSRIFRGGRVSPFGANLAVVLYRRLPDASGGESEQPRPPEFLVRLVYNEQVVPVPGCARVAGGLDCELDEFLALTAEAAAAGDSEGFAELCAEDSGAASAA